MDGRDMEAPVTKRELHESLDTWAGAINAGIDRRFEAVDRRFEAVDRRFEAMDKRFETMDQRFETMDQRFETMDQRFVDLIALIKTVESNIIANVNAMFDAHRDIPKRLSTLEGHELNERVGKLEAKVFAPRRRTRRPSQR